MSRRVTILSLVWLAALAAGTEGKGGAPLEDSKQELKKLQADQTTRRNSPAAGKLTEGMPQIQTPIPGATQLAMPPSPDKAEKDRKKKAEAQKNWLLDGVDKLGKSTNSRNQGREASGSEGALSDDEKEEPDSSDPNYMLKIYTEQKKTDEARASQQKASAPRVDPFAPFLQGWLDTSPVRGRFFDDFVRRPDAAGGVQVTGSGPAEHSFSQSSGGLEIAGSVRSVPATAQSNPYLQGLDTLTLQDLGTSHSQPTAPAKGPASAAREQPSGGMLDSISPGRPEEKKPLLLAPSDDKKYFPQLKKF